MARKIIYFMICCCISSTLFGQERHRLKGRIIADSIAVREVNIINLTKKTGTISLPDGTFEIEVNLGDSLFFSSLQYEPYQLLVTEALLEKEQVNVYLFPLVNELEEVNISDLNLSGDLSKDLAGIKTEPYFDPASKGLPVRRGPELTTAQRRIYTASSGNGIVPLDPIINALTGRMAMLHRQRAYEIIERKKEMALQAFSTRFFVEELSIPEAYIEDFVYYCMVFEPYVSLASQKAKRFEFIAFLKEKAIAYKQLKKIE